MIRFGCPDNLSIDGRFGIRLIVCFILDNRWLSSCVETMEEEGLSGPITRALSASSNAYVALWSNQLSNFLSRSISHLSRYVEYKILLSYGSERTLFRHTLLFELDRRNNLRIVSACRNTAFRPRDRLKAENMRENDLVKLDTGKKVVLPNMEEC